MSLYGWIIILSFAGPLGLSFDKKVAFYKEWRFVFLATICVALPFLIWDEFFTQWGVWGFNPSYLIQIYFGHLPLEEVLFFFVIPYNFIFLLRVIQAYFPQRNAPKLTHLFAFIFVFSSMLWVLLYAANYYTLLACALSGALTLLLRKKHWYQDFMWAYLLCLLPFFIVNGILTGAVTDEPIVWYSESHIIGWRMISIPFEDLYYNYALLLPLTWIYFSVKNRKENASRILKN
ncbi:MAG: lycopene cyclase domain-containing protein [Flavobacteriales bacterium]